MPAGRVLRKISFAPSRHWLRIKTVEKSHQGTGSQRTFARGTDWYRILKRQWDAVGNQQHNATDG